MSQQIMKSGGIDTIRLKTFLDPMGPKAIMLGRGKYAERIPQGLALKYQELPVVVLEQSGATVVLDLCGRWMPSMVKAMREYSLALGHDIKPSLAGGEFHAYYKGQKHYSSHGNRISIELK